MNTNINHGSAKIYQFPTNPRAKASTYRNETQSLPAIGSPSIAAVVTGGWYHDAAVREDAHEKSVVVNFPQH